jgi:hypothetical protein
MPSIPADVSTYPNLTTDELAARWHMCRFTISTKYRHIGLTPVRVGRRLLFPIAQIEGIERRSMQED